MSALGTSAGTMQTELGFSPATLDWELFAQSADGAVEVLGLGDDTSFDDLADRLADAGWTAPDDDDGVWVGGPDVVAGVGSTSPPSSSTSSCCADRGVVLASDQAPYLEQVREVVDGDADAADGAGRPRRRRSASRWPPRCTTAPTPASGSRWPRPTTTPRPRPTSWWRPPAGCTRSPGSRWARWPDGDLRAVLQVEDADDAPGDADARAQLAAGPAPGQGGDFTDRFSVEAAGSDGRVITLDLRPREGAYVLSDLTSGPVLFATC